MSDAQTNLRIGKPSAIELLEDLVRQLRVFEEDQVEVIFSQQLGIALMAAEELLRRALVRL